MFKSLIPYTTPEIDPQAIFIIIKNISEGNIKEGKNIKKFEKKIAEYIGTKYAITVASGRAALYHVYKFFLQKNKRVILPSYTCIPAIDAARWGGGIPYFLDIDLDSYNPKFDKSVKKVKNIGAISLSYLYGLVGNIEPFLDYAKENNIPIIEDSAIALGASYKNKKAGAIGEAGIFSLQESKIFTSRRGGVITTNNKELYGYVKDIVNNQKFPSTPKLIFNLIFSYKRSLCSDPMIYGSTMYPLKRIMTSKSLKSLLENIMEFNPLESIDGRSPELMLESDKFKFTNIQASIALSSFRKIEKIIEKRRGLAKILSDELKDLGVHIPKETRGVTHAYGRFPIRIPGKNKFKLQKYFLSKGIETSLNYPYIIPKTKFMLKYKFNEKNYPNAITASKETLLLPFHTHLKEKDLFIIINAIKELIK